MIEVAIGRVSDVREDIARTIADATKEAIFEFGINSNILLDARFGDDDWNQVQVKVKECYANSNVNVLDFFLNRFFEAMKSYTAALKLGAGDS